MLSRTMRAAGLGLLLAAPLAALAQGTAGFGDWQLHLPTNQARTLAEAENRIYVTTNNGFFYFDKETNTTTLLSRRDGLNGVNVQTVAYDSVSQQVLVAYRDGNLDLLSADGTRIRNVSDIQRSAITGAKTVNQVHFNGRFAYLSCDFGLLVLDLTRREVRDTYANIGPVGRQVKVYASTVAGNFIFAATSVGVLRALLTANLADYRSWTLDLPASDGVYQTLATFNGQVYAGRNGGTLQRYTAGTGWRSVGSVTTNRFQNLASSGAGLLITDTQKVSLLDAGGVLTSLQNAAVPAPVAAIRTRDGAIFVADAQQGLLKTTDRQNFEQFVANAPQSAAAFGLLADARTSSVVVFTGGFQDPSYVQNDRYQGFYEYRDSRWTNFTPESYPNRAEYPNLKDLTRGARTPDGTLYVGSYGQGLLAWKGPGDFRQYTPSNSPLLSAIPTDPGYTRVTDVAVAANGDVWVASRHPERPGRSGLHVFTPATETWRTIPFRSGFENPDRLALDDFGGVWVSQARKLGTGLMAFDEASGVTQYFTAGSGGLPSNTIYALVKDRRGAIWVGTDKGVAYVESPSSAFAAGGTAFTTPNVTRGSGAGFAALYQDVVRAVAVDGANRKWFGTDRGLWLFSENGDEGLLNFTTANSPLPSNRIVDIAVNDRTGDVFIATDAGVVSYRGSATVTEGTPSCAKVSPNPVRTNFMGQVGVTGLANNGIVKITDVTGKLVYQTTATGGAVTWNLADYNGRKVQSGVYLVLSSDADGKNGCVSKIAVVEQ